MIKYISRRIYIIKYIIDFIIDYYLNTIFDLALSMTFFYNNVLIIINVNIDAQSIILKRVNIFFKYFVYMMRIIRLKRFFSYFHIKIIYK